ncbi:hypothetical protein GCM10027093_08970 [Paraburkholderia jirisanensis]
MLNGLISGTLLNTPREGFSRSGSPYVAAKVRVVDRDGTTRPVNVVAYADNARNALLPLDEGDSLAMTGELTLDMWDAGDKMKLTIGLIAYKVTSLYS